MNQRDHMKIGRYQTWMENGTLKLYSHAVGSASGTFCSLDAEEVKGLLELLSQHREDINQALYLNEQSHSEYSYAASR
ncbi:MAG TPA: hypothetical protein VFB12_17355 [Ktedonobacteraceae bacterium]|nr:hypothetical protein [Ktedonobacteraceae bacterium]